MRVKKQKSTYEERQWRMLFIYNIYRFVSISVLFGVFWFTAAHTNASWYMGSLGLYFIFGLIAFYICHARSLKFQQQVLGSGIIDIIAMVLFIHAIGYLQSGLGILLNATIAVLSILVPGRLAVFFAALASCLFLGISTFEFLESNQALGGFFSTGIYGTGFFATALTSWYLARRVQSSEELAKRRSKELVSMQRLNEYIIERLHYGVIFVDTEMQVKVINTAAGRFFNLEERHENLNLKDLSSSLYQRYLEFVVKRKEKRQSAQTTIEKPSLRVHFFSASFADQTAVLIILDDMTIVSQEAQQLKLASLGQFSASIAHELRNPLGIIAHAIQLMGEDSKLNKEDARLKQLIINNCNRMNGVIKNVLQMSRRQQSKPEEIDLKRFLKQFKADFCVITQCDIILKAPRAKIIIVFDKSQLEQVLIILCENSLHHGRDKSGKVKITLSIKQEGEQTMLNVCDTGSGVNEAIRNTIFDPFFSTLPTGNGMGLFIAKDLCEINQAHINLMDVKAGCCFTITLNQIGEM